MRKTLLIFIIFFNFCTHVQAQFKQIASGPSFDEPQKGISKLVLFKDGTVGYFSVTLKEGINIRIYNKDHKETAATTINPSYGELKSPSLEAAFEINRDMVLLISEVQDKIPVLYRIIVDGTTGMLKKEEKIGELKKVTMGQGYAMAFGNVDIPGFYASKDPDSENYAVALFNSFEEDRNKRIEIVHYNNEHKEIGRGYYSSPDEKYKYLQFLSMAVMGSEKVSVMVSGYNTLAHGGKAHEVLLANLDKGASSFSFTELNFPKDSLLESGLVSYDPAIKKFVVIAKMYANKGAKEANVYLALVDPYSRKTEKLMQVGLDQKIADKVKDIYGKRNKYSGKPVNLYIHKDGSFSVVYEQLVTVSGTSSAYAGGYSSYGVTQAIVTAAYNKDGEAVSSYMVPKNFMIDNPNMVMRSISYRNEYKKFAYINCGEKSYVFINDPERNIPLIEKNKEPILVQAVEECDAFYFPLTGTEAVPPRKYLFGEPENKKEHNRALFDISTYDQQNDLFIVLQMQKEGRDKAVYLSWLKPQ